MVFGLFKNKEAAELAKPISEILILGSKILKSLPKRELICGYGEILKHALIAEKKFFLFLNTQGSKILNLESPFIEKAIHQSCLIKKKVKYPLPHF